MIETRLNILGEKSSPYELLVCLLPVLRVYFLSASLYPYASKGVTPYHTLLTSYKQQVDERYREYYARLGYDPAYLDRLSVHSGRSSANEDSRRDESFCSNTEDDCDPSILDGYTESTRLHEGLLWLFFAPVAVGIVANERRVQARLYSAICSRCVTLRTLASAYIESHWYTCALYET